MVPHQGRPPSGGAHTAPPAGARPQRHGGLHRHLLHGQLHLLDGGVQVQEDAGLLHVPDLHPHLSDRDDVLDQFLDQARGRARPCDPGRDLSADPLHPARQQPEVSPSCLLHQGKS